jgi:hypothetical protein
MKDFIFVPGRAINPAAISHVKYNKDGSVDVAVGADVIHIDPQHAQPFFDAAPKPAAKAAGSPAAIAAANAEAHYARNVPAEAAEAPAPPTREQIKQV